MVEAKLKSWILSFDELRILLYSLGFEKNEGILMEEKEFSKNDTLWTLHHLSRKNLIVFEDAGFKVNEELKSYLNVIGRPESAEIISGEDGRQYYIYFGTHHAVVTDRYWQRRNAIRISGMSLEQYKEWRESIR